MGGPAGDGRVEDDAAAAEEEHSDEGLRGVEAEGAYGGNADFVVCAVCDAVEESLSERGADAIAVRADGAGDLAAGIEAVAARIRELAAVLAIGSVRIVDV